MTKKLNTQNFTDEVLNATKPVLVDFYADWCGPCKMLSPVIEEIAKEHNEISVCKVNVDESPSLAMQYNVLSIPTMIVFKQGKETARLVGLRSKDAILSEL